MDFGRRSILAVLSTVAVLGAVVALVPIRKGSPDRRPAEACPASLGEWAEWRNRLFAGMRTPLDLVESSGSSLYDRCREQRDQSKFFGDSRFRACMEPIDDARTILRAYSEGGGESLEKLYAGDANSRPVDPIANELPPGLESEIDGIIAAMATSNTPATKSIVSRLPGAPEAFGYVSELVDHASTLLVYESPKIDKVVQIDQGSAFQLAIVRVDARGKRLAPPIAYFNGFSKSASGWRRGPDSSRRCITCHHTGFMPVVPKSGTTPISFGPRRNSENVLAWFNSDFAAKDPVARIAPYPVQNLPFPQYGEVDPPSRDEPFLRRCFQDAAVAYTTDRGRRVKSAMNCAECHDGQRVGKFTPFLRSAMFKERGKYIERNLIHGGWMPPKSDLDGDEKTALVGCLDAEYFGGFTDESLGGGSAPGTIIRELTRIDCPK